ncbi:MAG: bifunctional response regulator/alkaline phosphatase family protein, partial [Gemmatimonadota bacterium]|nr:bifunctional response regulator/alkaline phosphatase family protein [Gemmatimonadota bacterium]
DTNRSGKRVLWVDDEIDLLRPHLLFLQARGYHVDAISNGDDALALLREHPYDLVLLDEQMPGRRGLEVLEVLRRLDPHARVVMVTKSEEDRTMTEAIGRRVDDYLVKPTSPRQVLSVVTRILEGSSIRQQQAAQDFAARFPRLSMRREDAASADEFARVYAELVDWELRLGDAGEMGLLDTVRSMMTDLRRGFGAWIIREYPRWMRSDEDRPRLSVDLVKDFLVPRLSDEPVFFVVLDCMRLDQWKVITPLLSPYFDIEESYHYSILPTATPYARNAIFSGQYPDEIARNNPKWWNLSDDEGSLNAFEDRLLIEQLRRLTGKDVPVHYEKIFSDREGDQVRARVNSALKTPGMVVAMVFNFVDLMTHGRSESPILMEVAKDEAALRDLTRSWFERSTAFRVLREAAASGFRVIFTTDHGSILCQNPSTVFARRDATSNLRYKFGQDLRAEDESTVFGTRDAADLHLPGGRMGTSYLLALGDHFFVYPTKLREYQARYRNSFLHGGISPEEMIVPVSCLTPRPR